MERAKRYAFRAAAALCAAGAAVVLTKSAGAVSGDKRVAVKEVNYDDMTITVSGEGDTSYYISDENQKIWNKAGEAGEDGSAKIDISWIPKQRDYNISLKGDVSSVPEKYNIPKYNETFSAKYSTETGNVEYSGIPDGFAGHVEWRAKDSLTRDPEFPMKAYLTWNKTTVEEDPALSSALERYINAEKDSVVYFRLSVMERGAEDPVNWGRPSREVAVVIPKLKPAPEIKIDNEKGQMTVPEAEGVQYRVLGGDWYRVPGANVPLNYAQVAPDAFGEKASDQIVEFRRAATKDSQASASTFIKVAASKNAGKFLAVNLTAPEAPVQEGDAAVKISTVDYDNNLIKINPGSNNIVLYSLNKKSWNLAGTGSEALSDGTITMDIGWMNKDAATTLYLKGDNDAAATKITIPARASFTSAKFDKTSDAGAPKLTVEGVSTDPGLEWRKEGAGVWNKVNGGAAGVYTIKELEDLRINGGRIVVRIAGVNGKDGGAGTRPSAERTVLVPERPAAPILRLNPVTQTINTSASMEYFDSESNEWKACSKSMSVWDVPAADAAKPKGDSKEGDDVSIDFRKKATETNGHSKIMSILVKGQLPKPVIGTLDTSDVVYSVDSKTTGAATRTTHRLKFMKASNVLKYQYVVLNKSDSFDALKANWKTVENSAVIDLKDKKAASGAVIYVRIKGTQADANTGACAVLPSEWASFEIP